MARAARQRRENELPYIPFGPFQIRFPFIHYKIESVEFIQNIVSPALIVSLELSSEIVSAPRLYSAILSTLVFASMFRCETPLLFEEIGRASCRERV